VTITTKKYFQTDIFMVYSHKIFIAY